MHRVHLQFQQMGCMSLSTPLVLLCLGAVPGTDQNHLGWHQKPGRDLSNSEERRRLTAPERTLEWCLRGRVVVQESRGAHPTSSGGLLAMVKQSTAAE